MVAEKAERKRRLEEEVEARAAAKRARLAPALDTRPLTPAEQQFLHSLMTTQREFERPSPAELEQVELLAGLEHEPEDRNLVQMTQTTLATVKLIIEFTKRLPGFQVPASVVRISFSLCGV